MRQGQIERSTNETRISVSLEIDGSGSAEIETGVGFFDHMLDQVARHGLFDLKVSASGDLHIDAHHLVEDTGICLGRAFSEALGSAEGVSRYGHALVPMDEALGECAVDISGRPLLVFEAEFSQPKVGDFDVELIEEFWRAFTTNARLTMHLLLRDGANTHHQIEVLFKAAARALRTAAARDPRVKGIPSTKGLLET